jgi:hypothetical protein
MVRQLIPEGLAEMVPGPVLGALLAGIDIHALAGADAVEVLQARARQLSHEQARLLATMVEVGWCDPDGLFAVFSGLLSVRSCRWVSDG